jgi:large subunit ribosomal protein L10
MAVTRAEKETELQQLTDAFHGTETAVLVDYRGVTVPQVTDLRQKIRNTGSRDIVVKNTLAKRATAGTSFEALSTHFAGQTAVIFTGADPVAMAKALTAALKDLPSASIKAAMVQGQVVTAAAMADLANMPSKPELYARLLYVLNAPAQQLVTVLSAVQRDLVTVVSEVQKKREAQG